MQRKPSAIGTAVAICLCVLGALSLSGVPGCQTGTGLLINTVTDLDGNITVSFINETSARAAFSFGVYDPLDLEPPGPVLLNQTRVEAGTTTQQFTLQCRRALAIGTQRFVQRVLDTDTDKTTTNFDADAFDAVVHFSDAPADSALGSVATVGTAAGLEKLVGVDFGCGDLLIFIFREDPDAPGGFRMDFQLIPE